MGIIISFSGIDGAGKSTQVNLLSSYLKKKNKKITVTEEAFGYFLLKPFIKRLRKVTASPSGGPVTKNKAMLPKLWFIFAFIDIWLAYLFSLRAKKDKYDYLIADRFYCDIWANLLYYGYLPKSMFFLVKFLPKADIALWLSVDPKSVLTREKDFEPQYYVSQSKIYKKLADTIPMNKINADQTPTAVFKQIKALLQ